jgi:hypothetical protein
MKRTQWTIAALALAVMVFVATFAMNFLVRKDSLPDIPPDERLIDFTIPPSEPRTESEFKVGGHYDFWFHNTQEQPVKVGMLSGCTCSRVEVSVLPPKGKARALACEAGLRGLAVAGPWQTILAGPALYAALQQGPQPVELRQAAETTLPPGEIGWVRLCWDGGRVSSERPKASLWVGDRQRPPASFYVRVLVHEPVRLQQDVNVGDLNEEDLPRTVSIMCWSSTRPSLDLKVRPTSTRGPKRDPFRIGKPVPLTSAEMAKLEKSNNPETGDMPPDPAREGQVLCAYRIPITLARESADGTPFDIGPFRRWVLVSIEDRDPVAVGVHGRVRGLVEVSAEDDSGRVLFGAFRRSRGKTATVSVQSNVSGLQVKFDRARTPGFLDARLKESPQKVGLQRTLWTWQVRVLPDKAIGLFPRRDDPLYEDSAIYFEASQEGKPTRPIRVPVIGTANEG